MKFFLDSASLDEIKSTKEMGMLDGVTTNPSLFAKEKGDWHKLAEAICKEVDGPVSLEVVGTTAQEMLAEAKELVKFGPNVVVKIPMLLEGLKAVRQLKDQNIPVNVTLVFQPLQALMAAKAGATYVSPFVGRIDAIGGDGMAMVEEIVTIFDNLRHRHPSVGGQREKPHPHRARGPHGGGRGHCALCRDQGSGQASAHGRGAGDLP